MVENFDSPHKDSNLVADFGGGLLDAIRQPVDGIRQLAGGKVDAPESNGSTAETAGRMIGGAALFIGTTLIAKRLPGIGSIAEGRLAGIAAGGTLGFLAPVGEGQGVADRMMHGAVGATAMAASEFGGDLISRSPRLGMSLSENTFRNGLIKTTMANGAAGLIQTEGLSLVDTGHSASARDLALGAGGWAATAAAFHTVGHPLAQMKANQLEAAKLTAERPWQFKDVQSISVADLRTGESLNPGHYNVQFESQGQQRAFNLYVSEKAATANGDAPLVTFMHGLTPKGTADHIIRELSWNRFADRDGAVVAYLHGKDGLKGPLTGDTHSWNDHQFGYTKYDPSYSDRVAFDDMMKVIRNHVPQANADNIGVTGFSLGGKMANRIAAERPDVAALGTIHGTIDANDQAMMLHGKNPRDVDALFVLGTKDRVLPMNGGRSFYTMLLENANIQKPTDQARFWTARNNGGAEPFRTDAPEYVRRDWLAPNQAHGRVTEYVVKDGAHAIDGAHAKKNLIQWLMGVPKPENYFDARQRTWNFVTQSIRRNIAESTVETRINSGASA
jgi:poly(3-hydroxybutyrate) depolymerase